MIIEVFYRQIVLLAKLPGSGQEIRLTFTSWTCELKCIREF